MEKYRVRDAGTTSRKFNEGLLREKSYESTREGKGI